MRHTLGHLPLPHGSRAIALGRQIRNRPMIGFHGLRWSAALLETTRLRVNTAWFGNFVAMMTLVLCEVIASHTACAAVPGCQTKTLSVDVASADTALIAFFGRSWGETFVAQETLIASISVWLPAPDTIDFGTGHLYIMDVDSTGTPDVHLAHILLDGPVLFAPIGDGIHPTEFKFVLDPPFSLPRRGTYYFCVKANDCLTVIRMLADTMNAYVDGAAWRTRPTYDCNLLGGARPSLAGMDLVFDIEFCDTTTRARGSTWGQLKQRYR